MKYTFYVILASALVNSGMTYGPENKEKAREDEEVGHGFRKAKLAPKQHKTNLRFDWTDREDGDKIEEKPLSFFQSIMKWMDGK